MVIVLETSLQKHLGFVTQLLPKYQFRAQTFGYYHLSAGDLLREDPIFAEIEAFGASMLSPGVSLKLSGAQTRRLRVWPAHRELHQGPPSSKTENTGSHHKNCHAKFWHFRICHFFWNKSFSILEKWVLFLPSPENNYRFSCWFLLISIFSKWSSCSITMCPPLHILPHQADPNPLPLIPRMFLIAWTQEGKLVPVEIVVNLLKQAMEKHGWSQARRGKGHSSTVCCALLGVAYDIS